MEMSTVIRSAGEIRDAKADPQARTLTLSGEEWQLNLAEWIMNRLDRVSVPGQTEPDRYEVPGIPDPAVGIIRPTRADTVQNLQEFATMVRSVTEIRRGFTFNAARAMILRGTAGELDTAEWLLREIDRGPGSRAVSETRTLPGESEGSIRIMYLRPVLSTEQFLINVAEIRKDTQIRRVFTFNALRAVAVRGTLEQLAAAERMMRERQLLSAEQ